MNAPLIRFVVSFSLASVSLTALAAAPVKELADHYHAGSLPLASAEAQAITGARLNASSVGSAGSAGLVNTAESDEEGEFDSLGVDDRVKRLEQQMNNLTAMNMPEQISRLQQELAELRGQVQETNHALERLTAQLNTSSALKNPTAPVSASTPSPSASVPASVPASAGMDEANSYQAAFMALTKRDYAKAEQGFNAYLQRYEKGQFAPDAHYWLGEIHTLNKKLTEAESEFSLLIKQFPSASKVPDARLKLAIVHAMQGRTADAKTELQDIVKKYPGTTAAQLAKIRLQQLDASSAE
jgi:tol-pal system protein YbgF